MGVKLESPDGRKRLLGGWRFEYSFWWPPLNFDGKPYPRSDWMIHRDMCNGVGGCWTREDYMGRSWHFRQMMSCFFSPEKRGIFYFEWNPWAVASVDAFFDNKFTALMGAGGAGKSKVLAVIAVGVFMLSPRDTKVLVTSTTVDTAKGKVWGEISYLWDQLAFVMGGEKHLPGRKMITQAIIRYECDGIINHKAGIELLPTQQASEKKSVDKLQGYHNQNVYLLGDEWETLTPALINTVEGNLYTNPGSKAMGAFNPTGRATPGGMISKPIGGWDSITIDDFIWKTDRGVCLHFDAEKSPNIYPHILPKDEEWTGLPNIDTVNFLKEKHHGGDTASYYTMVRGFYPPIGEADTIYSEAELLIQYHADHAVTTWLDAPILVAGLDPSFSHGGDLAVLSIGAVGPAMMNGRTVRTFEKRETIILDKEIKDKTTDKSEQVVKLTGEHLKRLKIDPSNLAVDVSGAASFGSLLAREIGTNFMSVVFNGKPSKMPISATDKRKGEDVFDDMVSELWYVGKPLVRSGQIKGIDPDTWDEMCSRAYSGTGKRGDKIKIEEKKKMRKRIGKSPDRSDGMFLSIHVARTKHGLSSVEKAANAKPEEPLTELGRFFEANPHLLPPKGRNRKRQDDFENLESEMVNW